MTDERAAKVLAGVPRYKSGWRSTHGEDIRYDDALAALAAVTAENDRLRIELNMAYETAAKVAEDASLEILLRSEPDAGPLKRQMTRLSIARKIRELKVETRKETP